MTTRFKVIYFKAHPKYDAIDHNYDIAVAKIRGNFFSNPNLKAVKLPEPCSKECCEVCPGTVVKVAGYGLTEKYTSSDYLLKIEQTIGSKDTCEEMWESKIHAA